MLFSIKNGALFARENDEILQIEAWGTNALRVRSTKNTGFSESDGGLLPKNASQAKIKIDDNCATVQNGTLCARLDATGWLVFLKNGVPILREYCRFNHPANPYAPAIGLRAREYKPLGGEEFALTARFEASPNEKLYGMGQYQQPDLDLKGCVLELSPRNAQFPIPFYLSNLGYGFLWNDPSIGRVAFGKNYTEWESRRSAGLDYWITAGETPKEILKHYTEVTGRAPKFPNNMLGLWQCKLRYRTQEEVLEVAREYHRRGLPLDVIIIDFFHWKHMGDWSFDPTYWPDPAAMVRELREMGTRCMVSVWPTVELSSINYRQLQERGLLVKSVRGGISGMTMLGQQATFYDPTNPKAREFVWNKCAENYYQNGIDCFWLDVAEPEYMPADFEHYVYHAGSAEKTACLFPLNYAKTFYDGMCAAGQTDAVNLLRCAWVGSQRYAAAVWSGDIRSNFEALRAQLSAGLSIGIAGIPWWTTDTGGFTGDIREPFFNELLIRWFQFSTFCPILRMHGDHDPRNIPRLSDVIHSGGYCHTGQPHELWSYGEEVYAILKSYLDIRLSMKDYLAGLMDEASQTGSPLMRTMFYEFPNDTVCWELDEQYMLGDRYLVAPVMYEGMRERPVYFPNGQWKDIHTGTVYKGGQTITVPAPLEIIPVFERI